MGKFLKLPALIQEEITAVAYGEYLLETGAEDIKLIKNIFEKGKKTYILKAMERYDKEETRPMENEGENNHITEEIKVQTIEKTDSLNEIIGEYVSIPEFMVTVSKIAKENEIEIDFTHLVPIFKLFSEYEDKFLKISYNEISKKGIIVIK